MRLAPGISDPPLEIVPQVTGEQIRAAVQATFAACERTVHHAGVTLRMAVETGRMLIQAKAERPGTYDAWLAAEVPDLNSQTARRWRKLAEAPEHVWANATSLRQAYIAVGILPPSEPSEEGQSTRPAGNYLVYLSRAERALQKAPDPTTMTPDERTTLKERLTPLVELYGKL